MSDVLKSRRTARIFLSSGFIVGSAAIAFFWHHSSRPDAAPPAPNAPLASKFLPPRPPPSPSMPSALAPLDSPGATQESAPPPLAGSVAAPPPVAAERPPPTAAVQSVAPGSIPAAAQPPAPPAAAYYADGEFTGDSVDTYYGPLQVKVTVLNGDIVNADCPVYPNHFQRSEEISQWAIPILIAEVIHLQSADIDIVSGATQTSGGYYQSLVSALAKARK